MFGIFLIKHTLDYMGVIGKNVERGGEELLIHPLHVLRGRRFSSMLEHPTTTNRVHLEHLLNVNLDKTFKDSTPSSPEAPF